MIGHSVCAPRTPAAAQRVVEEADVRAAVGARSWRACRGRRRGRRRSRRRARAPIDASIGAVEVVGQRLAGRGRVLDEVGQRRVDERRAEPRRRAPAPDRSCTARAASRRCPGWARRATSVTGGAVGERLLVGALGAEGRARRRWPAARAACPWRSRTATPIAGRRARRRGSSSARRKLGSVTCTSCAVGRRGSGCRRSRCGAALTPVTIATLLGLVNVGTWARPSA